MVYWIEKVGLTYNFLYYTYVYYKNNSKLRTSLLIKCGVISVWE